MPQTKQQRQYWANQRKQEHRWLDEDIGLIRKPPGPVTLVATSPEEYQEIVKMHPGMRVRFDTSSLEQTQLFDTRGMKE